ncbi:2-polyprenylphenol 6-hydroxylase [Aceticella autotrophica]|uniref:2-polyprenylphenol 6-hydroxylase n=1 Tax=Aceticella autotrophica TaxID=2755338 RepID=A0A975G9A5_9THEO|nr:2-polyprenylphenol 6-hydroxylase [Aceticella autotrophica]QSZ26724.1 2-polyprenylphenol 6-hydroxylase [Aceticella autotrophica]
MRLINIFSNKKYIKRYKEILKILTKNGFGFIVEMLAKRNRVFFDRNKSRIISMPERIRITLEELGPTFVKMGQILSTRPDILPHEIIEELSKLQDNVPPVDFDQIKGIIEDELKGNISDLFIEFDKTPIASASIGQVYRAKTIENYDVVVKVQRPDIYDKIVVDISILKGIAKILNEHLEESPIDLVEVVNELSDSLLNELDYSQEGNNADRFKENFKNVDYIYVPKIYWGYTTKKVLTMEYIDGVSVKNKDVLIAKGFDLKKIAYNGAMSILLQIYEFGFFHGDPHPGNIFIKNDGRIVFIDFGIVGFIDKSNREMIIELFKAFADYDTEEIVNILLDMDAIRNETNIKNLKYDLSSINNYFLNTPLKNINIGDSAKKIMSIIYKYKLMLPTEFTLLLKALATIEGVGKELDPDFSISNIANNFIQKTYFKNFRITKILKDNIKDLHKLSMELRKFPGKFQSILTKVIKDDIKVKFNIEETNKMRLDMNLMINKIIISIIAASLIIGSSLIIASNSGYKLYGYNALGLAGFFAAFILCLWIFYNMIFVEKRKK